MDRDLASLLYNLGDQLTAIQRQNQQAERQRKEIIDLLQRLVHAQVLAVSELRKLTRALPNGLKDKSGNEADNQRPPDILRE